MSVSLLPMHDREREAWALVRGARRYIFWLTNRWCRAWSDEDREEALADALYAAYRAALVYDASRGTVPLTFIGAYVKQALRRATACRARMQDTFEAAPMSLHKRVGGKQGDFAREITLEDTLGTDDGAFAEIDAERLCAEAFERTATLNEQERLVLARRLDGATYDEIGAQLGVSRQRVEQVSRKALAKVREALDIEVVSTYNTKHVKRSESEVPQ